MGQTRSMCTSCRATAARPDSYGVGRCQPSDRRNRGEVRRIGAEVMSLLSSKVGAMATVGISPGPRLRSPARSGDATGGSVGWSTLG